MTKTMAPKADKVTIREVAADAGVSVAAVSKVMREAYGVSDAMRTKVLSSMAKLRYRPNTAARGMRGQTFTLGLIFPDLRNPFFGDILAGINSALERTQYQVLIGVSSAPTSLDEGLVDSMIDRQMDGLIAVGGANENQLLSIAARKPLVTIGNHSPASLVFDTVNNDDQLGAALVVRHLTSNGYRKIAMLSLSIGSNIVSERELGYRKEMMEHGLDKHLSITQSRQTFRDVQLAVKRILEGTARPDAIFCWTDFVALEVISVATEMGLRIPQDLAVVGYDNTLYCDFAQNNLTSIDQSGELLGAEAIRMVIERIKGRSDPEHLLVKPRIITRGSSRKT